MDYVCVGVIAFWKMSQIVFGIYCCLIVSRISDKALRDVMKKFDETSNQLYAVMVIVSLTVAVLVANLLLPADEINWKYGIQSVGILFICNFCLSMNLCPRLIAIWKGDQDRYTNTLEEEMRTYMIEKMKEYRTMRMESGTYTVASNGTSASTTSTSTTSDTTTKPVTEGKPATLEVETVYKDDSTSKPKESDCVE